jgi:outer membrane protein TolC
MPPFPIRSLILLLALCFLLPRLAGQSESYVDRARKTGNVQDLTLRQAIEMALTRNLDIVVEGYAMELNRLQLKGALGFYDPQLTFSAGLNSSTFPTANTTQGGSGDLFTTIPTLTTRVSNFAPGLTQNIPGGGSFSATFANSRTTTDDLLNFVNPVYSAALNLTFTQPLWRGFLGGDPTQHQIRVLQLNRKLTDSQFEQTVAQTVQQVHNGYWNLVLALESYEVARQTRDLALLQQSTTAQKVQSGLLAPLALTSDQAEVALHEQEMIQDEVQIISAENALRQMLSPNPADPIWNLTLIPTDRPKMQPLEVTMDGAIKTAIERRPELTQVGIQLEENAADRKYYKNQSRPAVNLSLGAGSVGASGTIFNPATGAELTTNPAFGGYPVSWKQAGAFDFPNWSVAVNVQIPLRNRTLEAQYATSVVNQQQLLTQQKSTAQTVIVDVRNAYESVQLQQKAVDTARINRELAEEQLRSATARFETGFTTTFEVLRYQRDLSDARIRELQAQINYQLAVAALQKAMNTIVSANDIELARPPSRGAAAPATRK